MPEGDTLFRTAAGLRPYLVGRDVPRRPCPGPGRRARRSSGSSASAIDAVEAQGKNLLIRFDGGLELRTHLRMNGSWHRYRPGERWRRPPGRARLVLEVDGRGRGLLRCAGRRAVRDAGRGAPSVARRGSGRTCSAPDFDAAEAHRRLRAPERADDRRSARRCSTSGRWPASATSDKNETLFADRARRSPFAPSPVATRRSTTTHGCGPALRRPATRRAGCRAALRDADPSAPPRTCRGPRTGARLPGSRMSDRRARAGADGWRATVRDDGRGQLPRAAATTRSPRRRRPSGCRDVRLPARARAGVDPARSTSVVGRTSRSTSRDPEPARAREPARIIARRCASTTSPGPPSRSGSTSCGRSPSGSSGSGSPGFGWGAAWLGDDGRLHSHRDLRAFRDDPGGASAVGATETTAAARPPAPAVAALDADAARHAAVRRPGRPLRLQPQRRPARLHGRCAPTYRAQGRIHGRADTEVGARWLEDAWRDGRAGGATCWPRCTTGSAARPTSRS